MPRNSGASPESAQSPAPLERHAGQGTRLPKASDVLAARLRARILGDALDPGTEMPSEAELIEMFGYSRSTVREALRLVEADGLIVTKRGPGGGIRVSRPDIEQISRSMAVLLTAQGITHREFLSFRQILEPPLAAMAAREATQEQREWLLALAQDEQSHDWRAAGSVEFHEAIGVCTNNAVARTLLVAMKSALVGHVRAESLTAEDIRRTTRAHVQTAKYIYEGKADEAERAMSRHIAAFIKVVDQQGALEDPAVAPSYWQS